MIGLAERKAWTSSPLSGSQETDFLCSTWKVRWATACPERRRSGDTARNFDQVFAVGGKGDRRGAVLGSRTEKEEISLTAAASHTWTTWESSDLRGFETSTGFAEMVTICSASGEKATANTGLARPANVRSSSLAFVWRPRLQPTAERSDRRRDAHACRPAKRRRPVRTLRTFGKLRIPCRLPHPTTRCCRDHAGHEHPLAVRRKRPRKLAPLCP